MSAPAEPIVVQITASSRDEAEGIARALVERRLAGSAQVSPLRTVYRWQGRIREEDEVLVRAFTRDDRFGAIAELVGELHSYELPQVVALPIAAGTPGFLRWIEECADPRDGMDG